MAEHKPHQPPPAGIVTAPGHPAVMNEKSDINVRAVGKFLFGLLIAGFIIWGTLAVFWRVLAGGLSESDTRTAEFARPRELPPSPRLQVTADIDLEAWKKKEQDLLTSYGTVSNGQFRIPIDRAIELLPQRKLPARPLPAGQTTEPRKQPLSGTERNPNEPSAQ